MFITAATLNQEELTLLDLADAAQAGVLDPTTGIPVLTVGGKHGRRVMHGSASCAAETTHPADQTLDIIPAGTLADALLVELCACGIRLGEHLSAVHDAARGSLGCVRWLRASRGLLGTRVDDEDVQPFHDLATPVAAALLLEDIAALPVPPCLADDVAQVRARLQELAATGEDPETVAARQDALVAACRKRLASTYGRDRAQLDTKPAAEVLHWDSPIPTTTAEVVAAAVKAACDGTDEPAPAWVLAGGIEPVRAATAFSDIGVLNYEAAVELALRTFTGPGTPSQPLPLRMWAAPTLFGDHQQVRPEGSRALLVPAAVLGVAFQFLAPDAPHVVTTRTDVDGYTVSVAALSAPDTFARVDWDAHLDAALAATT